MLAPPPVMRYWPLAASYWAWQPGGVCPTLPSFVKTPKSFACGTATATPSVITAEHTHTARNEFFLSIISKAPRCLNRLPNAPRAKIKTSRCMHSLAGSSTVNAFYINLGTPHGELPGKSSRSRLDEFWTEEFENSDRNGVRNGGLLRSALVCVQSLIGGGQHALRLVAGCVFLPANRILDRKFPALPGQFERPQPVQDELQLLVIAFRKNQQELVASHPHGEVSSPNGAIEGCGKLLKNQVPGGMAVGVVDVLELVEIEDHHTERMAFARRARHLGDQPLFGKPAVIEPRQGVNHGELAQDHRVMLLFCKLPPQPLDQHLLVNGVGVEEDDKGHQAQNSLADLDPEERCRALRQRRQREGNQRPSQEQHDKN